MRVSAILLTLCLLAGAVAADDDIIPPASCGPVGVPGGWTAINGSVAESVLTAVLSNVETKYGTNITDWLGGANLCPRENITFTVAGCQQVVAGTNYKLWVNMSCTTGGNNYTIGVTVDAFEPLATNTNTNTSIQIYDLDAEFLAVNGVIVDDDLDDVLDDYDDRWVYNSTTGVIASNDGWDGDDDDDDGVDDDDINGVDTDDDDDDNDDGLDNDLDDDGLDDDGLDDDADDLNDDLNDVDTDDDNDSNDGDD